MDKNKVYLTVGADTTDEEYEIIVSILREGGNTLPITRNFVRASADTLPVILMILAQGVGTNALWDLIKLTYHRFLTDDKLSKRRPTIVIKRNKFDAIISSKGFQVRSYKENIAFDNIESLIEYDKSKSADSE